MMFYGTTIQPVLEAVFFVIMSGPLIELESNYTGSIFHMVWLGLKSK